MPINGTLSTDDSVLPVAVDTAGGDKGLAVLVEGAVQAFVEHGVNSFLVGPQDELKQIVDSLGAKKYPLEIIHAPTVIGMDESPARAVRRKPDSSLCVAHGLVSEGRASAVISAGNSGAMMAAGSFILGNISGIERPAIATVIPSAGDGLPNVLLDSGANAECSGHNLVQFAIMGAVYYSSLFKVEKPRVALLSNGTESSKGTDIIRGAAAELSVIKFLNYIGFVEGRDIGNSSADVIVCDGFVGNVVLKAMEGSVKLVLDQLLHESEKSITGKIGLALSRNVMRKVFKEKFDHSAYGGAPLLGLKKLAIVLHGSSNARAVKSALKVSNSFLRAKMTEKIISELIRLEDYSIDHQGKFISENGKKEVSKNNSEETKKYDSGE